MNEQSGDRRESTTDGENRIYRRRFTQLAGASLGLGALGGTVSASERTRTATKQRESNGPGSTRPVPPGSRFPTPNRDEPSVVAHRCFAGYYPENTLAAMRGACTVGEGVSPYTLPDRVEIDLLPTGEGTVVVFHDDRLEGLTDESGVVWLEDDETVLNAEVLESGQTIPTLETALETIPEWMPVQLDIKTPGATAVTDPNLPAQFTESARGRRFVASVLEVVEAFDHDFLWSSFNDDTLAAVKELAPREPIMYLWFDDNERGYRSAQRLGAEAIGPSIGTVDQDVVDRAHRDNREVYVYTVSQWHEAERLRRLGVDHMITDYPRMWDFGRTQGFGGSDPLRASGDRETDTTAATGRQALRIRLEAEADREVELRDSVPEGWRVLEFGDQTETDTTDEGAVVSFGTDQRHNVTYFVESPDGVENSGTYEFGPAEVSALDADEWQALEGTRTETVVVGIDV